MTNQSEETAKESSLTPSTRKLLDMRKGKGPGTLTEEEVTLLRQSAREIREVISQMTDSSRKNVTIQNFIGMPADKTEHIATLEEIENAIASGWAQQGKSEKD